MLKTSTGGNPIDAANRRVPLDEHPDVQTARYLGLGRHRVTVLKEVELLDCHRDKKVPVKMYAPESGGPYPVMCSRTGRGIPTIARRT